MTYLFNLKKIPVLLIALSFLVTSCSSETEETIDKTIKDLPNGKRLEVEKTNRETTQTGLISKHNYGTTHSYLYTFSIAPEAIHWDGGSSEPKQVLFAKDTTYIRFLKEKSIRTVSTDSITGEINSTYHYEIQESFQKHIDERYFFKLFGDAYWTVVTAENYFKAKETGHEYPIPNDNELMLPTAIN